MEEVSISNCCQICFTNEFPIILMPCCGTNTSTLKYCQRCIELICSTGEEKIGRCPTCRTLIEYQNGTVIIKSSTNIQICPVCYQNKVILERNMCEDCLFGTVYCLRYECSKCHHFQRIPHPMWRYQENSHSFGTSTWACHQDCDDYTFWRVLPEDIPIIPFHDIPESWGMRNQMVAALRQFRRGESDMRSSSSFEEPLPPVPPRNRSNSSCSIM